ncbi:MAG: hypothetical protein V2B19_27270 [Pseudomonadota bacterium]
MLGKYAISIAGVAVPKLAIDCSSFSVGNRQSVNPPNVAEFKVSIKSRVSVPSPAVPASPPLVAGFGSYQVYTLS